MSKIVVLVETAHENPDEAARSVASAMRRAGFEVPEAGTHAGRVLVQPSGWTLALVMDGSVDAIEPEYAYCDDCCLPLADPPLDGCQNSKHGGGA